MMKWIKNCEAAEANLARCVVAATVYLDSEGHPEYEQDLRAALAAAKGE